jgi:hypothetical protein
MRMADVRLQKHRDALDERRDAHIRGKERQLRRQVEKPRILAQETEGQAELRQRLRRVGQSDPDGVVDGVLVQDQTRLLVQHNHGA